MVLQGLTVPTLRHQLLSLCAPHPPLCFLINPADVKLPFLAQRPQLATWTNAPDAIQPEVLKYSKLKMKRVHIKLYLAVPVPTLHGSAWVSLSGGYFFS